jgi:hypothetical protein
VLPYAGHFYRDFTIVSMCPAAVGWHTEAQERR